MIKKEPTSHGLGKEYTKKKCTEIIYIALEISVQMFKKLL